MWPFGKRDDEARLPSVVDHPQRAFYVDGEATMASTFKIEESGALVLLNVSELFSPFGPIVRKSKLVKAFAPGAWSRVEHEIEGGE